MSDETKSTVLDLSLRSRIAAAMRLHQWRATVRTSDDDPVLDCSCGIAFGGALDCQRGAFDSHREHVADAVIAALGLRQEFSVEYTPEGEYPPQRQRCEWSCGHERVTIHRDEAEFDAKSFYEDEPEEKPQVVTRYVTEWEVDE